MKVRALHIGVDDTDSPRGLCTTFLATELIREFRELDIIGHPRLVRLNPNIPWKTRGNGAIALTLGKGVGKPVLVGKFEDGPVKAFPRSSPLDIELESLLERADEAVLRNSAKGEKRTNPAVVVAAALPPERLYSNAVRELVSPSTVLRSLRQMPSDIIKWRTHRGQRGIVGASAAVAWRGRHRTFEIIAYRERKRWGTPRHVDFASVERMDREFPSTFNNIDARNRHIVIAPHSPCPVLFGIRAFEPGCLWAAAEAVDPGEPAGRLLLFLTNQGTDDHLRPSVVSGLESFISPVLTGIVVSTPRTDRGGHVFVTISDGTGSIDCAAFEPTKEFRGIVRSLVPGDRIQAMGGVHKRPFTLNLEKLRVLRLAPAFRRVKPKCQACGTTMKSMGRTGGYRCRRCRAKKGPDAATKITVPRALALELYEVPKCARRHLSRPVEK